MAEIEQTTETVPESEVIRYSTDQSTGAKMTSRVQDDVARFIVGGGEINVPSVDLPSFAALVAATAAAVVPTPEGDDTLEGEGGV